MQVDELDNLVVLAEFNTSTEAEMAKNLISTAGIYAEVRNGYRADFYTGMITAQLLVGSRDRDLAELLLYLR